MNRKKLIIGSSIAVGVLIILSFVICVFVYMSFILPITSLQIKELQEPDELKTPGVVIGADFLSKEIFLHNSELGTITDIAFGEFDPAPEKEIGIVGSRGGYSWIITEM